MTKELVKDPKENWCFICGSQEIITDNSRGERICSNCGAVLEEHAIDPGPEWRVFTQEKENKRVRASPTKNLGGTFYSTKNVFTGNVYNRKKFCRLQKQQTFLGKTEISENLYKGLKLLSLFCQQNYVPEMIQEHSCELYKKIFAKKITLGLKRIQVVAAVVYISYRFTRVPIPMKIIASWAELSKKELYAAVSKIVRTMQLRLPPVKIEDYLYSFADKLQLPAQVATKARELLKTATEKRAIVPGKNGLAAALLYLACQLEGFKKSQTEIAKIAGFTEVGLRAILKKIKKRLDLVNFLEKTNEF